MIPKSRKLLTIITEAALEHDICDAITRLGAGGYTITQAQGRGKRGIRQADWGSNTNIRIEVVCNKSIADSIVGHLRDNYYEDYAMILYLHDVEVLRPEKF